MVTASWFSTSTAKDPITKQAAWQQEVNYTITVELNDQNHSLHAQLSLDYINNSPNTLEEIYFHLWPNAYSSDKTAFAKQQLENGKTAFYESGLDERGSITELDFKVNGTTVNVEYSQNKEVVRLILSEPLKSGEQLTISTPFHLDIPKVFSRLGHDGQDYYMTQWYPKPAVYDVNGWNTMPYLDQGEFYSEFGSFDVHIDLPANYVLTATGETTDAKELAFIANRIEYPIQLEKDSVPPSDIDRKTVSYHADNVHDFAWFASKRFNIIEDEVEIDGRKIKTRVVANKTSNLHLAHIATALRYYSEKVGPYPYPHATVVNGELKAGGGMEYPMITLCDIMSEEVIVHEVGHNWFYGVLGSNERAYPWMDESINSYYDAKATASDSWNVASSIEDRFMMAFARDNQLLRKHQAIGESSAEFTSDNYGLSVYGLGARAFLQLEKAMGTSSFDKAMQGYYRKWKFKHPLPADMQSYFEESSGMDLSWFFEDVLTNDGIMDYAIKGGAKEIKLVNKGQIQAPVPVVFSRGEIKETVWASAPVGGKTTVKAPFSGYQQVKIDPDAFTMDINPSNDAWKQPMKFKVGGGFDLKDKQEINMLPALGWNHYDGFMLGGLFHNYGLATRKWQFHMIPLYGFKSKTLNGIANIHHTQPLKKTGEALELGVNLQRFNWSENGLYEFSYSKIKPYLEYHLPKANLRSSVDKMVGLSYYHILFEPGFEIDEERLLSKNPNFPVMKDRQFLALNYQFKNSRKLNPFEFGMEYEYGMARTENYLGLRAQDSIVGTDTFDFFLLDEIETLRSDHHKISAWLKLNPDIGIKGKPMKIALFVSYFLEGPEFGQFQHTATYTGNRSLYSDYRFDELSMYRFAGEGIFRNQIQSKAANSRFLGVLGQSDKMLANAIITVPLPGKIPLKPFVELMTFSELDEAFWNESGTNLIYNVGVEFAVIPDVFTVYFNLLENKEAGVALEEQGIDKFKERITFSLNLNDLSPQKLKRRINLF